MDDALAARALGSDRVLCVRLVLPNVPFARGMPRAQIDPRAQPPVVLCVWRAICHSGTGRARAVGPATVYHSSSGKQPRITFLEANSKILKMTHWW